MAATPAPPPPPSDPRLVELLQKAIAEHDVEVLLRTWELFCVPFLPVTAVILRASELSDQAKAHNLDPLQVEDAIALLGYLRASEDPHKAWLAAEIVRKHCQNKGHFFAAMMAAYKMPDEPKEEGDGQPAPQDHRLP